MPWRLQSLTYNLVQRASYSTYTYLHQDHLKIRVYRDLGVGVNAPVEKY